MRALVLALAAVLIVPAAAVAQMDWARAYEDGVEAFEKGNYQVAELKLKEARENKRAPKQSRRANFSSVVFKPFIPDFYLGVIYENQGRHKLAEEYLERSIRENLVAQGDRDKFALATTSLQRAREEQAKLAANTARPPDVVRPPVEPRPSGNTTTQPLATNPATNPQTPAQNTPTPANTVTPTPVRPTVPPPTAEPLWLAGFRRSMEDARTALRQSRFTDARNRVAAASNVAGDSARRSEAQALGRDIEAAQNMAAEQVVNRARTAIRLKDADAAASQVAALEALAPGYAALPELRSGVARLRGAAEGVADLARVERIGVKLFLSGSYKESTETLERAVGTGVRSPRIYLFLASSRAAQALLAPPDQQDALIAAARKHYELARPAAATLAADQRFISPKILQLLKGS